MTGVGKHRSALSLVLVALLIAACGDGGGTDSAPAPTAAAKPATAPPAHAASEEAAFIFSTRCFTCHGPEGKGNGPGSVGLVPPPRNFQDPEWQVSVTDQHINRIILYGGVAVGSSPAMPGNPDLISKPQTVTALVAHIRGLRTP